MSLKTHFRPAAWSFFLLLGCIFPVLASAQTDAEKKQNIEKMIAEFSPQFTVPEVDVETAKRLVAERDVVFLDVREDKEILVSTLPNAITRQQFEANPEAYKSKTIVAFCTIGYRSSKYVEKWKMKGFQMRNLRGSILLWSHANGALVDQHGKPTHVVHTYGKKWDLLPHSYQSIY